MTEAEKKMKKYMAAVSRRLNLPKDVRDRVMSDFASSVEARRERGLTEEEIYEELGTPGKAAAELNAQMKDFAYRKSPWRFVCLGISVLSGLWLVMYWVFLRFGMLLNTLQISFSPNESASIGIIGGADGPTSVFVAGVVTQRTGLDWDMVCVVLLLVAGLVGYWLLRRCKRK